MPSERKLLRKLRKYQERLERYRGRRRDRSRSPSRVESPTDSPRNRSRTRSRSPLPLQQDRDPSPPIDNEELIFVQGDIRDGEEVQQPLQQEPEPWIQALGKEYEKNKGFSGFLNEAVSKRWQYLLCHGFEKAERDELKQISLPKNCQLLEAPGINEEVKVVLTEISKQRDASIANQQHQLGVALTYIGNTMTNIIQGKSDGLENLKSLSNATKLLTDLHNQQTKTRKILIAPLLDKNFLHLTEKEIRNEFLYGENLAEKIKSNAQLQKYSSGIKKSNTIQTSINYEKQDPGKPKGSAPNGPPPTNCSDDSTQTQETIATAESKDKLQPVCQPAFREDPACLQQQQTINNNQVSPPLEQSAYPGSEGILREAFRQRGLPESSLNIMLSSVSSGTLKQYNTTYKSWWTFCQACDLNAYSASSTEVIEYLTERFNSQAGYSSLNTARSALSLLISEKIGSDTQIKRFFRGIYRIKPALRKYTESWDPSTVLKLLASLEDNNTLDLEKLTKKLVTLLALATAQRVQTLSLIKIQNISISQTRITIIISDLVKTSISSKSQTYIKLPFYNHDPIICPAKALQTYIKKTSNIRNGEEYLLLTTKKPYKRASKQTISRWIKSVLRESGIDTDKFSSHSTRHSATSTARQAGVSLDVIRKTAGWSKNSLTFAKFYDVQVNCNENSEVDFVDAVFNYAE